MEKDEQHPQVRVAEALEKIVVSLEHINGVLDRMINPPMTCRCMGKSIYCGPR